MLNRKVSYFKSIGETKVEGEITIGEGLGWIKEGKYATDIGALRYGSDGDSIKKSLPLIAFHGIFEGERVKKDFVEASGIIIIDIDDIEDDLQEVKEDIMTEGDHILSVLVSPSGTGLKVLYLVDPEVITVENYKKIGKVVGKRFELYGKVDYLSITDCLIVSDDPKIVINEDAYPQIISLPEEHYEEVELDDPEPGKQLWTDPEEFFETVLLPEIEAKSDNNYHFIQMSLFDLAKFGFKEPENDLSFVISYSEACHKVSGDNKKRYIEASNIASKMPQQRWPYKTVKEGTETADLDKYEAPELKLTKDFDGLINYSTLFERIDNVIKEGDRVGKEISLQNFSEVFRFKGPGILTVTGIPSMGKTEFTDQLVLDLARVYGDETIIAGFEQSPEEHLIKISRKLIGTNITCPSYFNDKSNKKIIQKAITFITSKIHHIDVGKTGGNIDSILEVAENYIEKAEREERKVNYLLIDPFNMLSIKTKSGGHEKIEEILRKLNHFSHQKNIMIILIAHPFKMQKDEKTGHYQIPDFYSVKGSSAFYEMSYHGLVVHRLNGVNGTGVLVRILKVKQNNLGKAGADVYFNYEINSGRYIPTDAEGNELEGDHWDRDWIDKI